MNIKLENTQVATDVLQLDTLNWFASLSSLTTIIGLYVELVTFFSSPSTTYVAAATSQLASHFFSHAFGECEFWTLLDVVPGMAVWKACAFPNLWGNASFTAL